MNDQQSNNFVWICSVIRDAMEKGMYGSITLSFQKGLVSTAKTETMVKAPVDKNILNA